MDLVEKLWESRKTFSGRVEDVKFVTFIPTYVPKSYSNYEGEVYEVTLTSSDGTQKTFRVYGKPPQVGSEQSYMIPKR